MAESGARMQVFECPICAPKRYFVTEIGLRTHVADRHPWRSLPPAQRRLTPTRAALPEPTWLRERQAAAAASVYQPTQPHHHPHHQLGNGGPSLRGNNNNAQVTFDTQSQLSDDVFFEEAGFGGGNGSGGGSGGRGRGFGQPPHQQRNSHQQRQQQPYASPRSHDDYPPPDYDLSPLDLARSVDAIDSSARKRRDLATARRPWYDSEDYAGPRNLMEKRPGGYFDDQNEMEGNFEDGPDGYSGGEGGGYSRRRMRHEIEERDSRIETLRLEIDRLWDERMRLLKREAEDIRAVKDQGTTGLYWDGGGPDRGRRGKSYMEDRQRGRAGHAFQPVLPHSRLQLYRQQPLLQQQQQLPYLDRRAMDY